MEEEPEQKIFLLQQGFKEEEMYKILSVIR